jgi:DNA-directed RNA polymerase specialized sigma24 family protein
VRPGVDHFPSTHATWIDAQLTIIEERGEADARSRDAHRALARYVMERYRGPLRAYVMGSGLRDLGDADELVDGFFAHFLASADALVRWRGSGMQLRRWLMNGMAFHGRTVRKDAARRRGRASPDADAIAGAQPAADPDGAGAFDRAWALEVVNEAHRVTHAECVARGLLDEYEVFRLHVNEGLAYAVIAPRTGRTEQQCANATRRIGGMLRDAVRELLRGEGVPPGELDDAVAEVQRLLGGA